MTEEERRTLMVNAAVRIVQAELAPDMVLVLTGTGMRITDEDGDGFGTLRYTVEPTTEAPSKRNEGTPTWPGTQPGEWCPWCLLPYDHQPGGDVCKQAQRLKLRPAHLLTELPTLPPEPTP